MVANLNVLKKQTVKFVSCVATTFVVVVVRPRRSRSAAAYSRQTFPWRICWSVGPYVHSSVCLSSALWKNGGSHPVAVWHLRLNGSMDGHRST